MTETFLSQAIVANYQVAIPTDVGVAMVTFLPQRFPKQRVKTRKGLKTKKMKMRKKMMRMMMTKLKTKKKPLSTGTIVVC